VKKVLLLNMPYGALNRPALGISLLKAVLARNDIICDIKNLNFTFAEFIGEDDYSWVSLELPYTAFIGDWTFTRSLYGENPKIEQQYIQEILRKTWYLSEKDIQRILHIQSMTSYFLDFCFAAIPWNEYLIVGFTSTFEQNIASLALAKRIKGVYPEIKIVFGGANWEDEMGFELHKYFPFVDYVCSGESEKSFPAICRSLLSKQKDTEIEKIPGIVYRKNGTSVFTGQANIVCDLDELPIPDYIDYFNDLAQCTVSVSIMPTLLFETSRGCWWGAKRPCMFCGLNGNKISFRSKSPHRALEEICFLVNKWNVESLEAVDNVIDMKYFDQVFPELIRMKISSQIFYEVRTNLNRKQIKMLSDAGVIQLQPGIESLNNNILRLMRKGTTVLKNIQFLKWCKEFGITAHWNLIYGFPGEKKDDYKDMLTILEAISFLEPPMSYGPIRIDRFSPYFECPEKYGFVNVRPIKAYNYIYPISQEKLKKIAYSFDYDYKPDINPTGFASRVIDYIEKWKHTPERGSLNSISRQDDSLVIVDSRSGTLKTVTLLGIKKSIYEFCEEIKTLKQITQHICSRFLNKNINEQEIIEILNAFIDEKFMVTDNRGNYLSLAIPIATPKVAQPLINKSRGNDI